MNSSTYKNESAEISGHEPRRSEGPVAKAIEKQTSKVPSDTFLWLALGSMGASLTLQLLGKKDTANFVGQWAPTLLILGVYNKIVKVAGSERKPSEETYAL